MLDYIKGNLIEVGDNYVVLENAGIGYYINFPKSSIGLLDGQISSEIKIWTYLLVKEDEMSLYGFSSKDEKNMFMHLISCDGVGPKGALNIISEMGTKMLIDSILRKDDKNISKVKGIGAKTASKICIELYDKIKKEFNGLNVGIENNDISHLKITDIENEVIKALNKLGFKNKEAKEMLNKTKIDNDDTTETLLSKILKKR